MQTKNLSTALVIVRNKCIKYLYTEGAIGTSKMYSLFNNSKKNLNNSTNCKVKKAIIYIRIKIINYFQVKSIKKYVVSHKPLLIWSHANEARRVPLCTCKLGGSNTTPSLSIYKYIVASLSDFQLRRTAQLPFCYAGTSVAHNLSHFITQYRFGGYFIRCTIANEARVPPLFEMGSFKRDVNGHIIDKQGDGG